MVTEQANDYFIRGEVELLLSLFFVVDRIRCCLTAGVWRGLNAVINKLNLLLKQKEMEK